MRKTLYSWIWRWHFIGGVLSLPVLLLLSITGGIYLFKDDYEAKDLEKIKAVEVSGKRLTYQEQWKTVEVLWGQTPEAMVVGSGVEESTKFTKGRFSHKTSFYIDPYAGQEKGRVIPVKTDMHKVRKLHGELLMGSFGTKIVELVASWMVVLLITGIYLFWPKGQGVESFFQVRFKQGKRIFFRDLHAVLGFWFSGLLLLILAGGLPWTDVFGSGYKWVQETTDAGFPKTWSPHLLKSEISGQPLTLDYMVDKAQGLGLTGEVSIGLPKHNKGVFSVSNSVPGSPWEMKVFHFDQYSGSLLKSHSWEDIGLMMKTRLWVMAFHQGQFGTWNFVLVLIVAIALLMLCIAAILSYFKRKPSDSLGIPQNIGGEKLGIAMMLLLALLGLLLPMFGLSLIVLLLASLVKRYVLRSS